MKEAIGAPTGHFSFYFSKGDLMRFEQAVNAVDNERRRRRWRLSEETQCVTW